MAGDSGESLAWRLTVDRVWREGNTVSGVYKVNGNGTVSRLSISNVNVSQPMHTQLCELLN